MLTRNFARTLVLASSLIALGGVLKAQDSGPLIDLLVKKGIVNDQEAEELKAELVKSFVANSSAGKLNLGSSVSEFAISGDVRLRHETSIKVNEPPTTGANSTYTENNRERFRLRLNMDAKLQNGWSTGLGLQTASASDSGNQTLTGGNDNYSIYLSRAYIAYKPNNEWSFVGGKFKNPLFATDLEWDPDINPQGVSETFTKVVGGLSGRDTLEVRAMQSIVSDNNEVNVGPSGRDAYQFAQQIVYTGYFKGGNYVIAPGYSAYNDSNYSGTTLGNSLSYTATTRFLKLFTLPWEVNFLNVAGEGTSVKVYGDYIHNFAADDRVHRAYGLASSWDKGADSWLVGVGYFSGAGKTAGDWSVKADYREIGIGAQDPNTNDSDFAFSALNQRGVKTGFTYNITDFATFAATYFYTNHLKGYYSNTFAALAPFRRTETLQLDLSIKF